MEGSYLGVPTSRRRHIRLTDLGISDYELSIPHVPSLPRELLGDASTFVITWTAQQAVIEPATDEFAQGASSRPAAIVEMLKHCQYVFPLVCLS
jgi:hypothetical protein